MNLSKLFPYEGDKTFSILICIVLFVPLVFSHFTYEKFETIKLAVFAILTGLAMVFFVYEKKTFKIPKIPGILLGTFLFLGFWATLFSEDKVYSFLGKNYLWTGYFLFILCGMFLLLLSSTLTKDKLHYLWQVILATSLLNCIWSLVQAFGIGYYASPISIDYLARPPGFLGNPNFSAMFLACVIPVAIYFCVTSEGFWQKTYYTSATFLLIFAEMIISSRGAIIGFAVSLLALFVFGLLLRSKKLTVFALVSAILMIVFYFLFSAPFRDGFHSSAISETTNITQRFDTWSDAFKLIENNLWTGIGFGNFIGTNNFYDPHNIFLHFLLIGGIPLIVFLLVLASSASYVSIRKILAEKDLFLSALFASFIGFLAAASFNPVPVSCWFLLALILVSIIFETNSVQSYLKIKLPAKSIAAVLIAVGAIFFASEVSLYRGLKLASIRQYDRADQFAKASIFFNPYGVGRWILVENEIKNNPNNPAISQQIEKIQSQHRSDDLIQLRTALTYYDLYLKTQDEEYFKKSITAIENSIEINPTVPYGYFYLAYEYFMHQEIDKALYYSKQGVVLNPGDKNSWLLMANAYLALNKPAQAILPAKKTFANDTETKPYKHWVKGLVSGKNVVPYPIALPKLSWD